MVGSPLRPDLALRDIRFAENSGRGDPGSKPSGVRTGSEGRRGRSSVRLPLPCARFATAVARTAQGPPRDRYSRGPESVVLKTLSKRSARNGIGTSRRHSRERGCQEIGCTRAVRASRRARWALLSIEEVLDGIKEIPHPEEAAHGSARSAARGQAPQLSRRTQGADPADCRFPDSRESGNPGPRGRGGGSLFKPGASSGPLPGRPWAFSSRG
jgi:hypothetical protein